jgi:hypothetical protein
MKKLLGIRISILLAILLLPVCANAITFTSDANIQTGDTWMNVYIYDTPPNHTTVTMTGGSVNDSMGVHNASTFNMSGGNVGGLGAMDESTANISGGSVIILNISSNATATISQNGSIFTAHVFDSSVFNMNGGTIAILTGDENATLNLWGGNITDMLGAYGSATINVFGYNLAKTNTGGTHKAGQVTGFWQNNSSFTINLGGSDAYSHINLIPEPVTISLLLAGILGIRNLRG